MQKIKLLLIGMLLLSGTGQLINAQTTFPANDVANPKDGHYAFTNASIVKDAQTTLQNATLIVRQGKIVAVGNNIAIPKDAVPRECRFAVMIEGDPETVKGKLEVPVSGRIGVIVYLAVGDVAPNLKILTTGVKNVNGKKMPAIKVSNTGNAHARLEGYAELVDAKGVHWTVVPENFPVLAGETRLIALVPQVEENKPIPELAYPVKITGKLDVGKERIPADFVIGP